ncbi:hypothetical protein ACFVMC_30735 [Nocardia sp. NPDC127579]|uniref:hypothetical protein n=1 Tax=Nocardia sp. NPDC127579 TaxID=3345402 RepID=UPI00362C372F
MTPDWLMHDGEVVPSIIVLSHAEQRERLRMSCPDAVPKALVAGDICFDRLRASQALRASYRRAFGLTRHQKLVVVSSTWGPESLVHSAPDLPLRLAEQLPADEFRVLLAPHPNIVAAHSSWQFGQNLAAAIRAGVTVPEDVDAWRAAIVAADLVVGDHGSVPFYSTALGIPLLLAAAPLHRLDPRSPTAQLLHTAPILDPRADLVAQVRHTIAEHDPRRYSAITTLGNSEPDASPRILRTAMYHSMGLAEPAEPAELSTVPLPTSELVRPTAYSVHVSIERGTTAHITRFPAERLHTPEGIPRGSHVVVGGSEPRRQWLRLADALIGAAGTEPEHWIAETLACSPGLAIAAAPLGDSAWLLGDRSGTVITIAGSPLACELFTSVAVDRMSAGRALSDLHGTWTIHCAGRIYSSTVRAAPSPDRVAHSGSARGEDVA